MSRDFDQVRHDLEQVLVRLLNAQDPELRQKLLRRMRRLLDEADHLHAHEES